MNTTGPQSADGAPSKPELQKAAQALHDGRPRASELILRSYLDRHPGDVDGMALLADALVRLDRHQEAAELLAPCLEQAPGFAAARHLYVTVLLTLNRRTEAFAQIDMLLDREPEEPRHRSLKAMAHAWVGDHAAAAHEYERVLAHEPRNPAPYLAYGHTLRTLGRGDAAVAAYREIIRRFPKLGEAYWSLANLKTFRFTAAETETMQQLLDSGDLTVESRIQINFALGKALEDEKAFAESFARYDEGNALKRATLSYNAELTTTYVLNCQTLFSAKFFADRAGWGSQSHEPIFIVGLPRSGSTLIEQILASHSAIEGTMELRILPYLVSRIASKALSPRGGSATRLATDAQAPYPEILRNFDADALKAIGEEYLERARMHRTRQRSFFIDKMPDNFAHIGLIQLVLPNAKIIDARRHPLACCFSNFKQYFPLGKDYSYRLSDLGRYYADYTQLMTHFDAVLPGKVHRVFYERMINDSEGEIRRLLDYLGLPFEERCLRFHETERAVRTASSEQVRMPIFTDAQEQWRNYEPWLEPLKTTLGPALTAYQDARRVDPEGTAASNPRS